MNEVRAEVQVPVSPDIAFALFTQDVDQWWRRGQRYGGTDVIGHRCEPWVGGRFLEVLADREDELGRVTSWEPAVLLAFTWRQGNWRADEVTQVEVRFDAVVEGTRVRLRHHGFDSITSDVGCEVGYETGWQELLSWYAQSITDEERRCT